MVTVSARKPGVVPVAVGKARMVPVADGVLGTQPIRNSPNNSRKRYFYRILAPVWRSSSWLDGRRDLVVQLTSSQAWGAADATIDELRISDIPRLGSSQPCNRIIVADSGNHRIQAFDELGNSLDEFGRLGIAEHRFNTPQGLAVDPSGRVIVVDQGNNRLVLLNFDGYGFDYSANFTAGFDSPTGNQRVVTIRHWLGLQRVNLPLVGR